jgi:hypothetical protein
MWWQRFLAAMRRARTRNPRNPRSFRQEFLACPRPLSVEPLESRVLMAADMTALTAGALFRPTVHEISPQGSFSPVGNGYSPSQIRRGYNLDQVLFGSVQGDGAGQTIAIIDAYHSPTITQDLHAFDAAFGLPDPPSFRVVAEDGSTHYPPTDPSGPGSLNWETETALDIEWAHALAPSANLLLVEAKAPTSQDLIQTAVDYARRQSGVSVISMSFGSGEYSGETQLDSVFTTVAGHNGVTFIAASGDSGTPAIYPAVSLNVLAVGGTTLSLDASGTYLHETGWDGSGGGISYYEPLPRYQSGVMAGLGRRGAPDVAFDADPNSGVPVYDSYNGGTRTPWIQVGGTSFSSPALAAMVAIANQGRALGGLDSLDGPTQTLPLLYALPGTDFHDIVSGNNGRSAGAGYDLVTGLGSPVGNRLLADMASATSYGNGGGASGGGDPITPPPNDNFAAASVLNGTSASDFGSTIYATQEAGEPAVAHVSGSHSVWWNWKAAASGTVVVTTRGSDFDTTLGVFAGNAVSALTSIAENDDEAVLQDILTSRVSFSAVAGTTYHIVVNGYHEAIGNVALGLTETAKPSSNSPANDNFSQRTVVSGGSVSATGSNANATAESGEPRITGERPAHSVWWSWTAPSSGQVTISTKGSNFDTLLGVYTGTSVNKLKVVAQNDQDGGRDTSRVTYRAVKGVTYQIAVDGYDRDTGRIALKISMAGAASSSRAAAANHAVAMSATAVDQALIEMLVWETVMRGKSSRR